MKAAAIGTLVLLVALVLLTPLAPADVIDLTNRLSAPSVAHPFGTDHLGRDVALRLMAGAQTALVVVAVASCAALVVGTAFAAAMVALSPTIAAILRRLCDLVLAVPRIIAAIVVAGAVGLTPVSGALALSLNAAAGFALVAHGLLATAFAASHVRAAEALGGTRLHVLRRHVLPEVMPSLVAITANGGARVLLAWAALTFLGLGADTSTADWGAMVWEYRLFLFDHPHLVVAPCMAIAMLAWTLSILGDPSGEPR